MARGVIDTSAEDSDHIHAHTAKKPSENNKQNNNNNNNNNNKKEVMISPLWNVDI